jgi:UDP-N-acetylmuramyl pentapeptide synthase
VIFTAQELTAATGGELVREGTPGSVSTDTRAVRSGQWFLALTGERFDGDAFVDDALAAGCAGVVSTRAPPANWTAGYVRVKNTTAALQALAFDVRRRFEGPVVGITGSVGKTTARDMCALALGNEETHATQGNFNNHVGLPLTILRAPPCARAWVLEMGMSAPGEIAALAAIARPNVRVVTNVAPAHLEGVGDVDGVARAKAEMFASASEGDVCVVNADDARVMGMPAPYGCRRVSFGTRGSGADVEVDAARSEDERADELDSGVPAEGAADSKRKRDGLGAPLRAGSAPSGVRSVRGCRRGIDRRAAFRHRCQISGVRVAERPHARFSGRRDGNHGSRRRIQRESKERLERDRDVTRRAQPRAQDGSRSRGHARARVGIS